MKRRRIEESINISLNEEMKRDKALVSREVRSWFLQMGNTCYINDP